MTWIQWIGTDRFGLITCYIRKCCWALGWLVFLPNNFELWFSDSKNLKIFYLCFNTPSTVLSISYIVSVVQNPMHASKFIWIAAFTNKQYSWIKFLYLYESLYNHFSSINVHLTSNVLFTITNVKQLFKRISMN